MSLLVQDLFSGIEKYVEESIFKDKVRMQKNPDGSMTIKERGEHLMSLLVQDLFSGIEKYVEESIFKDKVRIQKNPDGSMTIKEKG